jgi:hypothetical protein
MDPTRLLNLLVDRQPETHQTPERQDWGVREKNCCAKRVSSLSQQQEVSANFMDLKKVQINVQLISDTWRIMVPSPGNDKPPGSKSNHLKHISEDSKDGVESWTTADACNDQEASIRAFSREYISTQENGLLEEEMQQIVPLFAVQ